MARVRFGAKIGTGGFGEVCHATRVDDEYGCAVKRLRPEYASNEDFVRRFRREVRMQRGLDHPNILPILGANLSTNPPWFLMPYAPRTLWQAIQGGLAQEEVHRIFREILAGLAYAHSSGVLHRDLKPENVLLSENGDAQLADFGLGKDLLSDSTGLTRTAMGAGSFPYTAPEQVFDLATADHRADIFSAGKLLQAMLTGRVPILSDDQQVDMRYRWFINKCTAEDPALRYQSMDDVVRAFDQVVLGVSKPQPPLEAAELLVIFWKQLPGKERDDAFDRLREHLAKHGNNAAFMRRFMPGLSDELLRVYVQDHSRDFLHVLREFDRHVDGDQPFEYCDVVANWYRRIYDLTTNLEIKQLVLARLFDMGPHHNRYHVGSVLASLLAGINETSEAMMAADIVSSDKRNADWLSERAEMREASLVPVIEDALYGR